jgi:putative phosphoesterase
MKQLAVLADTHGNSWALEAVLEDIKRRDINDIVNLGDTADADMDPSGAIELMMRHSVLSIAGNYETYHAGQITSEQENWLKTLPKTMELGEILCCHGTPFSNTEELVEKITVNRVELAPVDLIAHRLRNTSHKVVLCAHKHVPRLVMLPSGQLIVNPGSVGLPSYWNDEPVLHTVEAGSPHARYAILRETAQGWAVDHIALPYSWQTAAEAAKQSNRYDRAQFIETGRAEVPKALL